MQMLQLRHILENSEPKDRIAWVLRSLRHDSLVWSNLMESSEDQNSEIINLLSDHKLDPGTLGLLSLDSELVTKNYPDSRLQASFLEGCMGEFESFIQAHNPPISLTQAAKLAIVLVEKRKISPAWSTILLEVINRMRISSMQTFYSLWKTPLAIAINLVNDQEELLSDLFKLQTIDQGIGVFVHVTLCLPLSDEEMPQLIEKIAGDLSPENQGKIARYLVSMSEKDLAKATAKLFIDRYQGNEIESENITDYWSTSETTLQKALAYQQLAGLAQIAEETDFSLKLIDKAAEMLTAILNGVEIQKIATLKQAGDQNPVDEISRKTDLKNFQDPALDEELAYAGYLPNESSIPVIIAQPAVMIQRAKLIQQAGNSELAKAECEKALDGSMEQMQKGLIQFQPRFNPNWDPTESVSSLLSMGAIKEAASVSKMLLEKNPTSAETNRLAVEAFLRTNNYKEALPILEMLSVSGDHSISINRSLAESYQAVGENEACYQFRKQIIESEEAEQKDLLDFAESAVRNNMPHEAFNAVERILVQDPGNPLALSINGMAYYQLGEIDDAIASLSKAIEAGTDDPQPWMTLSEIYVKQLDHQKAIETLRNGMISLASNVEIKKMLADLLMKNGSIAEALPLINDLAENTEDLELKLLQTKAMKTLGLADYSERISLLFSQYPENPEIAFDHAEELMRVGKRAEAKSALLGNIEQLDHAGEKALIYADVVAGIDFQYSGVKKTVSSHEDAIVLDIIQGCLTADPENIKALVLKAEILTQKGLHDQAFGVYSKLIEKQNSVDKSFLQRIQAGFALTSAILGKFELALAAIKEAVDAKPEWVGLRRTLAVIYSLAGQISDATDQAQIALELAPQIVENLLWFVDLMTKLGKTEEAEQALQKGLTENVADLLMAVKMAELLFEMGKMDKAAETAASVKQQLSTERSDEELIASAKLFVLIGDSRTALECLEYRISNNDSLSKRIDLAGYYYLNSQYDKVIESFAQVEIEKSGAAVIANCLIADTLAKMDAIQAAYDRVQSCTDDLHDSELDLNLNFVPDAWNKIIESKNPCLNLESMYAFQLGKPNLSLSSAKRWLELEPENAEARIIALESALALGEYSDLSYFCDLPSTLDEGVAKDHLATLKMELALNKQQIDDADRIFSSLNKNSSLSARVLEVSLKAFNRELTEAESDFELILSDRSNFAVQPDYLKVGCIRNLVKAAVLLQRWNEALTLSSEAARKYPWNLESVAQHLITLVSAREFENSTKAIAIEIHSPQAILQTLDLDEELLWLTNLLNSKPNKELERWLLRGKMASAPKPETIRAFALVTPRPDDAAAMMAALRLTGQSSTAIQVSKKYASSPRVLYELGLIQSEIDVNDAINTLEQLLSIETIHPIGLALKSKLLERTDKLDFAINNLEQAISYWPNEVNWRVTASGLWEKLGNVGNSIIHLEAAHELQPQNVSNILLLSKAYLLNGSSEKAVESLEPVAMQNPNHFELWEVLADAYSQLGDSTAALRAAGKASEANPFSTKPYLMSGRINLEIGELDKALEQAKLAVTRNNKDAESIIFLAKVLTLKGEKQQALAALEMSSQCENATIQTMIDHVNLVKEINGASNARELIASLSEKYPENVELLKMLAKAQNENGDANTAEQTAKRALQVNPEEPELHLLLGKINSESGHLDQAIHHLSQGIANKSDQLDGYLMLSKVYEQQREFTKAMDILKQAMEVNPGDTRSYLAAANLYKNSKNYPAAEQMLQKAVEVDPKDLTVRRQLGALLALNLVHHSQEVSSKS